MPILPESLQKSIALTENLSQALTPFVEQQSRIQCAAAPLINSLQQVVSSPAVQDFQRTTAILASNCSAVTHAASTLSSTISSVTLNTDRWLLANNTVNAFQNLYDNNFLQAITQSTQNILASYTAAATQIANSPALQWISSIDFSPLQSVLQNLHIEDSILDSYYRKIDKICLAALYECKWFPYASWSADFGLAEDIYRVLFSSRGCSKRREKRIDKLILNYYTTQELKNIKCEWRNSDLPPHIKKILGQAIEAHIRGEYALSIACFSTMWEGLIHHKLHITGRYSQKKTGQGLVALIEENNFDPVFGDFYEKLIVCDCNTVDEVVEGVPNRNGVSHSKYKKYPNKKASLNAILITDFIIHLEPKQEMEESKDGHPKNAQP